MDPVTQSFGLPNIDLFSVIIGGAVGASATVGVIKIYEEFFSDDEDESSSETAKTPFGNIKVTDEQKLQMMILQKEHEINGLKILQQGKKSSGVSAELMSDFEDFLAFKKASAKEKKAA